METRKRKALADISNTANLIPTSVLRKLVASTDSNSISKPPIYILRSYTNSTNQKLGSDSENRSDVRSDASVGSSNISSAWNSRTVQFRTPILSPGDVGSKAAACYCQKQNVEKSNNETDADAVIISHIPVEKRKDKGKSVAVQFCSPQPMKIRDRENAISNHFRLPNKVNLSLNGYPAQKVEYGKGIVNPTSCSYEKSEKGISVIYSSSCSEGKSEEIGKGMGKSSSRLLSKTTDKGKGVLVPSDSSIEKSRGDEVLNSSRFISERNKEKGKAPISFDSSNEKAREKGKVILYDRVDIAKHLTGAVNYARPRNKIEKSRNGAGTSSCPPTLKTKNIIYDFDGPGSTKPLKSMTDPRPATRKKRCPRIIPLEDVEQQKAYFEEVDAFELQEEEVSEGELD